MRAEPDELRKNLHDNAEEHREMGLLYSTASVFENLVREATKEAREKMIEQVKDVVAAWSKLSDMLKKGESK